MTEHNNGIPVKRLTYEEQKLAFAGACIISAGAFLKGILPGAGIGAGIITALSLCNKQTSVTRSLLIKGIGAGATINALIQSGRTFYETNGYISYVKKLQAEEKSLKEMGQ